MVINRIQTRTSQTPFQKYVLLSKRLFPSTKLTSLNVNTKTEQNKNSRLNSLITKNIFLDTARANRPIFMEQQSQDLTTFYQIFLVETKLAKKHGYTVVRYAGFAIKAKKKDEQPIYIHNFEEFELFKITAGLNNDDSNIPV
jgi:hypothetical protein